MYVPKAFEETRPEILRSLMQRYPLAVIVADSADGLVANHVPLLVAEADQDIVLRGHIAKANRLWQDIPEGGQVMAIFQGPQAYISPNWYPSKAEHGRMVPTWNYATVHANGTIHWKRDHGWLYEFLDAITRANETGQPQPWHVADSPREFIDQLMNAIVGFEIRVSKMIGKWKVSQNRDMEDRQGVISALESQADSRSMEMANLIREFAP
jgi:transcriptional regulator